MMLPKTKLFASPPIIPGSFEVDINPMEYGYVSMGGMFRRISALLQGRNRDGSGERTDLFDYDIVGMLAEFVYAKYYGKFWAPKCGELDTNTGDMANRVHIKSIFGKRRCLAIRREDPIEFRYVLVKISEVKNNDQCIARGKMIGWLNGSDRTCVEISLAKSIFRGAEVREDTYFVDPEIVRLRPMSDFKP